VRRRLLPAVLLGLGLSGLSLGALATGGKRLPLSAFQLVERVSGPVNYYSLITTDQPHFIRSNYQPGYKTAVVGYSFGESQQRASRLSWRWRAQALPRGGNECGLDLRAEFRKHFEDGDPEAEVPDLFGVGLMSDGDQTKSHSSADFADFTLL
jgi:hypothetical protein